jgi:acyl-CoA synthetase (AMP-forming)/AMP-acid ligase II
MGWQTPEMLPDPLLTCAAVLARRAAVGGDAVAFSEVQPDARGVRASAVAWSEVNRRMLATAAALAHASVAPGDRVALCLRSATSFLPSFLAAQGLGAIPVPLPSLSELRARSAFASRVRSVAADCSPRAIVVDDPAEADVVAEVVAGVRIVVANGALAPAAGHAATDFARPVGDAAFIQYTSGTTGRPKGVMVSHGNLRANMRAMSEAAHVSPSDRSFSWLPLYHDMGLVGGFLLPLYLGIPTFMMPAPMFVARPDRWLLAMSQLRATSSCAPNFAYAMLARRLPDRMLADLDLSSWRLAFNGAEPIDRSTVEAFERRFAPVGFRPNVMFPVYGMAECVLGAAFSTPGEPVQYDVIDRAALTGERRAMPARDGAASVSVVCAGRALPGHVVRIVDPDTGAPLPDRHVGEVAVTGPSVTSGYFRADGSPSAPRQELRTGDLGYCVGGDLYVVDRLKDLMILGGRNIVPAEVERVVCSVSGVRHGAAVAFAIRREGTEALCIVAGAEPQANRESVRREIRAAVVLELGLTPHDVLVVRPGDLPKTSSGKNQRAVCRERYEQNQLGLQPAVSDAVDG